MQSELERIPTDPENQTRPNRSDKITKRSPHATDTTFVVPVLVIFVILGRFNETDIDWNNSRVNNKLDYGTAVMFIEKVYRYLTLDKDCK